MMQYGDLLCIVSTKKETLVKKKKNSKGKIYLLHYPYITLCKYAPLPTDIIILQIGTLFIYTQIYITRF